MKNIGAPGGIVKQRGGMLFLRAKHAIARVTEAREDVAPCIQLAVKDGGENCDIRMMFRQFADTFRCCNKTHEPDTPGAATLEKRHRRRGTPAGCKHRVQQKHQTPAQPLRELRIIINGLERLFVPVQSHMTDACLGKDIKESVNQAQPRPQYRHDHNVFTENIACRPFEGV